MTAKKKTAPKEPPEFPEMTSAEWEIEDFLEEWGPQTAVVEIYRRKDDGSMPHVRRVDIGIITADLFGYLRQHFGNGKYVLMFKNEARRVVKRLTIEVEGADVKPNGAASGAPTNTFLEQMLLAMIAAQKPAPPIDIGTLIAGIGSMMTALKPTASDPATMLTAMATTFQQLKPDGDGVEKALTIISKAKEIGGNGGGGEAESWPGLIKEGLATAATIFQNRAASNPSVQAETRPAIPPGATPVRTIQSPATPAMPTPTQEPTGDQLLEQWLRAQIAFLKQKARAGKNPDDWADYTEDNAEEPGCAAILEALRRGATLQHLLTFDEEIGKDPLLAGWFQRYYESLQTPVDEEMDSPGAGGNAGNPPGNAKPSVE